METEPLEMKNQPLKIETNLLNLPASLLISKMTYYSFDEVRALCSVNQRMREICTDPRYSLDWKTLIQNTYGKYADKLEHYDYLTYVKLIDTLPANVQIDIYRRQEDWDNYYRVVSTLPYGVQLDIYRKDKKDNAYYRIALIITFPEVNIDNVTDYTGLYKFLAEGYENAKIGLIFPAYSRSEMIIPAKYIREMRNNFSDSQALFPKFGGGFVGASSVTGNFGEVYKVVSRVDLSKLDPQKEYEGKGKIGMFGLELSEVSPVN